MATNIHAHAHTVTDEERAHLQGQRPVVIWFTGLSGSGKSTIAGAVDRLLQGSGHACYILDGDNVRTGLNADLGFSPEHRSENVRRVREVGKLIRCAGLFCLIPLISPYRADRDAARAALPEGAFLEVFVNTPLAACEERDPKGLYAKARRGEIRDFTGIDAPYEPPLAPDLELDASGGETPEQLARQLLKLLQERGHLASANSSSSSSALGVARAAFCASHASSSVPSSSSSLSFAAGFGLGVAVACIALGVISKSASIPGGSPRR